MVIKQIKIKIKICSLNKMKVFKRMNNLSKMNNSYNNKLILT
jgi:hypothetical protein